MIRRDAIVEGSGNFDNLGFLNVHLNLSKWASSISSIGRQKMSSSLRLTPEIYFAFKTHSDLDSAKFLSFGLTCTKTH